jgi:hypothetical protein
MKLGIDWKDPATWRGLIMGVSGVSSLMLFFLGEIDAAQGVVASGITISGALGFGVKN